MENVVKEFKCDLTGVECVVVLRNGEEICLEKSSISTPRSMNEYAKASLKKFNEELKASFTFNK